MAVSGPGGGGEGRGVAGAPGGEGREAARCSCAEDRDDGRGRPWWDFPVATQRQVSTVHTPRLVQLLVLLPCLLSSVGEPAAEGRGGGRRPRLLLGRG